MSSSRAARAVGVVGLISMFLIGGVLTTPTPVLADPPVSPAPVELGTAATYSVLSGASVANTLTGPVTTLRGDLGVSIVDTISGFPPGVVTGIKHNGDSQALQARADLVAAYIDAAGRTSTATFEGDQIGAILTAGVYHSAGAVSNTGTMTLDGQNDPNAVFVLQVGGALGMAAAAQVKLINGTQASRVFWQVNGAATLGAGAKFAGTIMALDAIGAGAGAIVNGRFLARNGAVTLDSNEFYTTPPVVTISSGSVASATTTTPTISGTTDIAVGQPVTVTIDAQSLTATVQSGGAWSTTAAPIINGTFSVVASVIDAQGNRGSATQSLTIDTVLPALTITGGATALTNDSTPTIAGTSDVAAGATINVTGAGAPLTALVQVNGTWNATPATLTDGAYGISATVQDPAGNTTTATQSLTLDTIAPTATIIGGATALTNDPTPTISGTSDIAVGQPVSVTIAGQSLATTVQSGGTWFVTAAPIVNGTFTVVASVIDFGGNPGSATQSLTIDTILPALAISGGPTLLTNDPTPTIAGSSDVAAGTIVTITGAGSVLTAVVQANGTWNATPAATLTDGTYGISATVQDPAGNTTTATQSLAIARDVDAVPGLVSVGPMRVFDTRPGFSPSALRSVPKHPVGGADELRIQITDLSGFVPATGVSAVSLNITATNPVSDGFITVYACGTRELVSSVNFLAGQTVANAVVSPVSATGAICIFSSATTDIVADINGWFPTGGAFTSVGPRRVFDTRPEASPALRSVTKGEIPAGGSINVPLTGLADLVPEDGVSSVSLNVTVTNPEAAGFITVYACGTRELVSSVNYTADQTVANAVIAPVSSTGAVCFYSSAKTHLVVDINGWLKSNSGFTAISPQRVLDTRPGQGTLTWREVPKRQVGGDYVLQVKMTDLPGLVPGSGVGMVSLNVTATDAVADGFVTVYPCGPREDVSSVNYVAGRSVANAVLTPVSTTGTICIYALAPVDIIVDINGWFSVN